MQTVDEDGNVRAFTRQAAERSAAERKVLLGCRVLDVGGGFPGGRIDAQGQLDLGAVPAAVNAAVNTHFPPSRGVDIIAEPGRCEPCHL